MSVRPTFEIGGSVFNSFQALRGLIAATAEDDVHTQAVLAVEQLGACIPVAAERINEAVDALGGQTSVKVQNLQASIGISSGGLCKMMRQSTPLLQFFVLCSACKMTFLDEECSTLVFEMLKTSSVLAKLPCSAVQIARMITHFSGQADMIAPVDFMHEIASVVDEYNPGPDTFRRLEFKALAELLTTLFESIRDETVESVTLTGHDNCIWLVSTLLWLMGEEACMVIDNNIVKGGLRAKLCIKVEPTTAVPWNLQVFKESKDPTEYVFGMSPDEVDSLNRIPLRSLKSFMTQYYWSSFEQPETYKRAAIASGIIAQTFIVAISLRGLLYLRCGTCGPFGGCNSTKLSAIAHSSWLAAIERVVTRYGWSEEAKFDPTLLSAILKAVDLWRQRRTHQKEKDLEGFERNIKEPCQEFIHNFFVDEKVEIDYILDPALFTAADAAVTCTATYKDGWRYIKPLDDQNLQFADSTVLEILSCGLEVSEFRKKAFMQLLPGLELWQDRNLVVTRDGYTAGMGMLWAECALQSDALNIRMQRGNIKKDQVSYSSICENSFNSIAAAGPRVAAFDAVKGLVMPEVGWQHQIKDRAYTFETSAAIQGARIELKHYMAFRDNTTNISQRRKASWISAINILATASHIDAESQMTAVLIKSLNARMTQKLMGADICWTDPFCGPKVDQGIRTMIRSGGDPIVKIFSAGACYELRSVCCHILIRHQSPLLYCIEKAESMMRNRNESWIIVD